MPFWADFWDLKVVFERRYIGSAWIFFFAVILVVLSVIH